MAQQDIGILESLRTTFQLPFFRFNFLQTDLYYFDFKTHTIVDINLRSLSLKRKHFCV